MMWLALLAILVVSYYVVRYFLDMISISDLSSRHVFITGCDTGFGHELALKLAARGMPVFAGCFSTEGATKLSEEARGLKGPLKTVPVDVTNQESVDKAVERVTKELGSTVKNEYGREFVDDLRSTWRKSFIGRASPHTELVINAYMHALTAAYPRTRYVVGWDARLLWIPLSLLPLDVQDFIMNRVLMNVGGAKAPLPRCLRQ
uniref:Uncharacterized protein n=1 Tax=Plectus sambesii TaxID=2011161 RepID=A0A914X842_9BILA